MARYRKSLGNHGEDFAAALLEDMNYDIMERNFRTRFGEIDIIARKDGVLHFIEVKTRMQKKFGYPAESVTAEKQRRIRRVAEMYMSQRRLEWEELSFDVMEVYSDLIVNCM